MLLVYALSCFGQEELTLKAKQEEVLTNLNDSRDVFACFLRDTASICATVRPTSALPPRFQSEADLLF